jgi:hypothetical protein
MRAESVELLVDEEIAACEASEVLGSSGAKLVRSGTHVFLTVPRGRDGNPATFDLDCSQFDAQPISVDMVTNETHESLPMDQWTPGVPHSLHPVTGRPFVCLQGIAEYHSHPSHVADSWDRYRTTYRLPQLVRRLLEKAGAS